MLFRSVSTAASAIENVERCANDQFVVLVEGQHSYISAIEEATRGFKPKTKGRGRIGDVPKGPFSALLNKFRPSVNLEKTARTASTNPIAKFFRRGK